ncbi:MAG TPA: hypothetical protein VI727_07700 [Candidatus Brocadiaceae bacterium]|nr:hypothetical protein [Candidatus Brocadiaceae bacterium]
MKMEIFHLTQSVCSTQPTSSCPRLREGIGDPKFQKSELLQKTKKLQMPFIANNGQMDEKVKFYANTFGGTVFITKDGEIVYALPKSGDVEDGETHRKLVLDLDRGAAKCAKERSEKHISHQTPSHKEKLSDFVNVLKFLSFEFATRSAHHDLSIPLFFAI